MPMAKKTYTVCLCGNTYRSDGAYAKEACPTCLPALRGYVRTPQQAAALAQWRIELGLDKPPAELTAA